ncbi:hypothetical protein GOP47_0009314 [Adiantum capillus-veneris]|uniref:Uncharacterized protein n=1 Tax=Adiantum capillus-veneris TaxID=13818 RepID=A0A9D4UWC5_ADICA|nr:hypothetical protein GOP47_0009314 [Adiantum capillus-veneris]
MILGASISTIFYNLFQRHPTDDAPLVNYLLGFLLMPMMLLGISIGIKLNVMFPGWLITIILVTVTLVTSFRVLHKARNKWIDETNQKMSTQDEQSCDDCLKTPPHKKIHLKTISLKLGILKQNLSWMIAFMVLVWVVLVGLQVLQVQSRTCSQWYWVFNSLQVCSATSTFVMMFTSALAVIEYSFLHRFPLPYGLLLSFVAFTGGLVGQHAMQKLVKILGRPSIIIFLLCFLGLLCTTLLGGLGVKMAILYWKEGKQMGFTNLC